MHYRRIPGPVSWERILCKSLTVYCFGWLAFVWSWIFFLVCMSGQGWDFCSCCVLFVLGAHSHPGPGHTRLFPVDGKLTLLSSIFEPNRCQLLFVLNVEESMFIMNDVFWKARCCPRPSQKRVSWLTPFLRPKFSHKYGNHRAVLFVS